MAETTYWRALNRALTDEMAADPQVFVMGEDITSWGTGGGIFGVTRGLLAKFGPERVRETPISEEVMVAAAVGAAMRGQRPVVEIMYSDFSLLALDGIVNQAAKIRYMFGGQFSVPMVVRSNGGAGGGKAAQHSQSLETIFAHVPGLEVAIPATPGDAYGLLRSAIRSDNPTVFLEHKALYNTRGPVGDEPIPFGRASVVREGDDLTIVASQLMLARALAASEDLAAAGISAEVIDPRTLFPLDIETICRSARQTHRLMVVHEAPELFGYGAEIAAQLTEELWGTLVAPVRRLGGARTPIPYARELEDAVLPSETDIATAARELAGARTGVAVRSS